MVDRPHVRVDPAQRFGYPAVKGVSVEAVAGLLAAGESMETVAGDFGLARADVLVACWYLGIHGPRKWRQVWGPWARAAHQSMWAVDTCDYDAIPDPPELATWPGGLP